MEITPEMREWMMAKLLAEQSERESEKAKAPIVPVPIQKTVAGIPVEFVPPDGMRARLLLLQIGRDMAPYLDKPESISNFLTVDHSLYQNAVAILEICYPKIHEQYGIENITSSLFESLFSEVAKYLQG